MYVHLQKDMEEKVRALEEMLRLQRDKFTNVMGVTKTKRQDAGVWQRVLQCVAVCCSDLQYAAVCCRVLPCPALCCSVLQCVAVCCSVLQCVAVCCSVSCIMLQLQYSAACCSVV